MGRIIVDSFHEIVRLAAITRELGRTARVMVRVTAGVEAHTHEYIATAHEDQKFGFSISSGDALDAVQPDPRGRGSRAARPALAHRLADLRLLGLRGCRPPGAGAARADLQRDRRAAARARPRRRLRDRLHHPGRPVRRRAAGHRDDQDRARRVPRPAISRCPRLSIEPGRAIAGPAVCTVYEVGTVKAVELDGGAVRTYVSVDGGMSDNIRTALYDADYSCTLANRVSDAPALMTRLVGKHCEAGDIVVKDEFLPGDVAPGDLVAVPGHGCLLPLDGQQLQPRPPAAGDRGQGRRGPGRRTPRDDGRPAGHRPRLTLPGEDRADCQGNLCAWRAMLTARQVTVSPVQPGKPPPPTQPRGYSSRAPNPGCEDGPRWTSTPPNSNAR